MNRLQDLTIGHMQDTVFRQFAELMQQFVIVDIGVISSVYNDGTVDIRTGRAIGSEIVEYTHVELLAPGSSEGTFNCVPTAGSVCLVFSPYTVIPRTKNMETVLNKNYSIVGMKAIMLSAPNLDNVKAGFNAIGNFILQGKPDGASITVDKEGDILLSAGSAKMYIDESGSVKVNWPQRSYKVQPDGTMVDNWYNTDGYLIRTETSSAIDGTITTTIYDGTKEQVILKEDVQSISGDVNTIIKDKDGNTVYSMIVSSAGQLDLSIGADPGATISITPDGAVTINTKKAVSVATEDSVSIEASKECTVKGSNVTVSGNVTITGGSLKTMGTAAVNPAGGPFCAIPTCLFTGAPHLGNMVQGT